MPDISSLFLLGLLVAALLTALIVVWPLLRRPQPGADTTPAPSAGDEAARLNQEIIRERRARLDEELAELPADSPERTALMQAFASQALADLKADAAPVAAAAPRSRQRLLLAAVLAMLVVALPLAFYRSTGMPEAADPAFAQRAQRPDMHTLLAELEQRLAQQPELVEGWLMLGRSRMSLGERDKAIAALEKALQLDSPDPALAAQIRTDLADALGQQAGSNLRGRPWELLQQALRLKADNPKAMALAGAYQLSQNQPQAALQYWEPLLAQLQPGTAQHQQVAGYIANVRALAGLPEGTTADTPPTAPGAGAASAPPSASRAAKAAGTADAAGTAVQGPVLSGQLAISPALASATRPDDTVFLAVRAVDEHGEPAGPPLAVRRLTVAQLPHRFTLSDADAMLPAARLSQHPRVQVIARIGRDASPQPGDLEGRSPVVAADADDVQLLIDRRLP
ncbi:MAG: c-type cytochrome biogenesis protein CcmI [Lautropia sp.]|nr:c-type cytochrome biogenesis protein CcmI [Lautropia sp.]